MLKIVTIRSPLPATEVRDRIARIIEPESSRARPLARRGGVSTPMGPYLYGNLSELTFKAMVGSTGYASAFRPIIGGSIEPQAAGATVRLVIRVRVFAAIIMALWFGFLLWASYLWFWGPHRANDVSVIAVPLGTMSFAGLALSLVAFFAKASWVERRIRASLAPGAARGIA